MRAILKLMPKLPDKDHGKFSVLGYWQKSESDIVTDKLKIMRTFLDEGNVFGPSFYLKYPLFSQDTYLLAETIENPYKNKDKFMLDDVIHSIRHSIIKSPILKSEDKLINLESLSTIESLLPNFYIFNDGLYWGPFYRDSSGIILSRNGNKVNVYSKLNYLMDQEIPIVYDIPKKRLKSIPVFTASKIQKWFRKILQGIDHPVGKAILDNNRWYQELKDLIELDDELSRKKLRLALNSLRGLEITLDELKSLLSFPQSKAIFTSKIDQLSEEIKASMEDEVRTKILESSEEIKQLIKEKSKLKKELKSIKKQSKNQKDELDKVLLSMDYKLNDAKEKFEILLRDINYLEENKEEIIIDIRLKSDILKVNTLKDKKQVFISDYAFSHQSLFNSPKEIKSFFNSACTTKNIILDDGFEVRFSLAILLNARGVLSNSIEFVIAHLLTLGRCKVKHIQVQADWLTHQQLSSCNLDDFLLEAFNNSMLEYYVIFQDFNIASPECYLRPILDFMRGSVPKYQNFSEIWPSNFHLVGITLPVPEVGLQLLKSTLIGFASLNKIEQETIKTESWPLEKGYINEELLEKIKNLNIDYDISEYAT